LTGGGSGGSFTHDQRACRGNKEKKTNNCHFLAGAVSFRGGGLKNEKKKEYLGKGNP